MYRWLTIAALGAALVFSLLANNMLIKQNESLRIENATLISEVYPKEFAKQAKEPALRDWVYQKSTKISKTQAEETVVEVAKYKNPLLLLSLMQAESEFSPTAISSAGAIGLGQVMWKHWGDALVKAGICKEKRDLFDYRINIQATSFILQDLLTRSGGNVEKALDRYLGTGNKAYKNKIVWNFMNLSILNGGVTT